MKRFARACLVAFVALASSAHVGSPDVWYDGTAGPYPVRVHIAAPGVIPGIATINVRVDGENVQRVTATANRFDATGGAPPPEIAQPVEGRTGWFRTKLWIMTSGSYSVTVNVAGARGGGDVVVPLAAFPNRRLGFAPSLGIALGAMGLVLFFGALTIVGAGVREAILPPGVQPDAERRRRARRAMLRVAALFTLVLAGAWRWWGSEDAAFERSMFSPLTSAASVRGGDLVLAITDSLWIMRNDAGWQRIHGTSDNIELIADHGKLMHMFVVDASGGRAFAHVHPVTRDSVTFTTPLPPLPAGRYSVFGDIVHESGLTQTLVASVELGAPPAARALVDTDDSFAVRTSSAGARTVTLGDGSTMAWIGGDRPLIAGTDAELRFAISAPPGALPLELYMGMPAHAAVVRDDAKVFIHLHPLGTISMAAQRRFVTNAANAPTMIHAAADTIAFPYAFPEPGNYHIWVQVKRGGRVFTGAFDATVSATTGAVPRS